jgi:hypothetical protein
VYVRAVLASFTARPVLALTALAALLVPAATQAHFILQSPPAAHEQDDYGDPQKAPPCGDAGSAVATGAVTAYQAGDTITITIDETIYHPGHYRIALAVNDPSELPEEPPVTPDDTPCGTAPIQNPPVFPVLADGVFAHTEPFGGPQSIDITVPDGVSCDNCTLQVIQFMSNHGLNNPGGCYYHHCASIAIQGGQTTSAEATGEPSTSSTDETGAPTSDGPGSTSDASAGSTGPGEMLTSTAPETTTATTPGVTTDGDDDDKGCACTTTSPAPMLGQLALLAPLALLGLRRRRHSRGAA